jgi:integral membrane sensor domain MASE1
MRELKPLTILALGTLLSGIVMTVPILAVEHDARNLRGVAISVSVGAALGLLMFAPIAFAVKFRVVIRAWVERSGSRVQPRVACIMALALGYWFASMRHHTFDVLAFIAMGLVLLCALFGVVIGVVNGGRRSAT